MDVGVQFGLARARCADRHQVIVTARVVFQGHEGGGVFSRPGRGAGERVGDHDAIGGGRARAQPERGEDDGDQTAARHFISPGAAIIYITGCAYTVCDQFSL
ncbi:MAG: hypothetical protein VXX43_10535 [Pseudomonadota bacterium]|nr:hypothetical protein [Pseudomonadota bacterium]